MRMFSLKETLKSILPQSLVRRIRHNFIIKKQKKCRLYLNGVMENFSDGLFSEIKPLKKIDNPKVIWQYWAQGFESSNIPDLVKVCLKSVELNKSDYALIRLSDENIDEYLELPGWIKDKMSIMSKAHFSDLLRCIILSLYGGVWLDAATFLTGEIPHYVVKEDFFLYRRDGKEKHKAFWESTFAYYFGYSAEFYVKSLIGIMYSRKGGTAVSDFASMLLTFWKNYDSAPDYFFFQILIEEYFERHSELLPQKVNDTIPHLLRQYINELPAPDYSFPDILKETTIHSLNYKSEIACQNLLALFPEYKKHLN